MTGATAGAISMLRMCLGCARGMTLMARATTRTISELRMSLGWAAARVSIIIRIIVRAVARVTGVCVRTLLRGICLQRGPEFNDITLQLLLQLQHLCLLQGQFYSVVIIKNLRSYYRMFVKGLQ